MSLFPFRAEHLPEINARLSRRPSLAEAFALLFGVGFTLAMMVLSTNWGTFVTSADFSVFLSAVHGEYRGFFYAYWSLYLFAPFTLLNNILLAYLLWNIINLAGVWFAARVFNGRPALALLSYQMLFSLYYGQIVGVIVAGIALTYLGLLRRSWLLTGVGIALACIKPQMGVSAVLVLVLVANIPWRERLLAFLVPGLLLVVTLLQYGGWPLDTMIRIFPDRLPIQAVSRCGITSAASACSCGFRWFGCGFPKKSV